MLHIYSVSGVTCMPKHMIVTELVHAEAQSTYFNMLNSHNSKRNDEMRFGCKTVLHNYSKTFDKV